MTLTSKPRPTASLIGLALLLLAPTVLAYSLKPYKWPINRPTYYVNPKTPDLTPSAALAAIKAGANAWANQSNANFAWVYGGTHTATAHSRNGRNEVLFRSDPAVSTNLLGAAYSWYNSSNQTVEVDIVLHDYYWQWHTGTTGCVKGQYVEETATHEFGHGVGLNHSAVVEATMYGSVPRCSLTKRSLAADDIAGIQALYP